MLFLYLAEETGLPELMEESGPIHSDNTARKGFEMITDPQLKPTFLLEPVGVGSSPYRLCSRQLNCQISRLAYPPKRATTFPLQKWGLRGLHLTSFSHDEPHPKHRSPLTLQLHVYRYGILF